MTVHRTEACLRQILLSELAQANHLILARIEKSGCVKWERIGQRARKRNEPHIIRWRKCRYNDKVLDLNGRSALVLTHPCSVVLIMAARLQDVDEQLPTGGQDA